MSHERRYIQDGNVFIDRNNPNKRFDYTDCVNGHIQSGQNVDHARNLAKRKFLMDNPFYAERHISIVNKDPVRKHGDAGRPNRAYDPETGPL